MSWARNAGDCSNSKSDDEDHGPVSKGDISTPTLVTQPCQAGFSAEQIAQAEADLDSISSSGPQVRAELKIGSTSKQIVDIWIQNQKNKIKPWSGPLLSPRRSPLRTLSDAVANARYIDHSYGSSRKRGTRPRQSHGSPTLSSTRPRQPSTPAVTKVVTTKRSDRSNFQDQAAIKGVPISNSNDGQMVLGRHDNVMGQNRKSSHPNLLYRPTPGFIVLFGKTGGRRHNPNPATLSHRDNHSYTDVVRSGMDPNGTR
jgi:hypothetical protein